MILGDTSATGDGSRRHQEVDSPVIQDGEREAEALGTAIEVLRHNSVERESALALSMAESAALLERLARLVVERDAAERALERIEEMTDARFPGDRLAAIQVECRSVLAASEGRRSRV